MESREMVYEQSDLYSVLPENTRYQDDGCSLFYSCLSCPFPCCVYDLPGGDTKLFKQYRDREIIRLAGEGVKTKELATCFKVTQRCVELILQNTK